MRKISDDFFFNLNRLEDILLWKIDLSTDVYFTQVAASNDVVQQLFS